MNYSNIIESIELTEDKYLTVAVKDDVLIDNSQFSMINSGRSNLINCTKDRYEENTLLYYIGNYISLNNYILENSFDFHSLKSLLLKLTNEVSLIMDKKLTLSNAILYLNYIFIDTYTNEIKLIYIPATRSEEPKEGTGNFQKLLKDIINNIDASHSDVLMGFIINHTNLKDFNLESFQNKLKTINYENLWGSNSIKNSGIFTFITTVSCVFIFCILIPLIGNLLKISFIKEYINYYSVAIFCMLFIIASVIALIITMLMENKKVKKQEVMIKKNNSGKSREKINTQLKSNSKPKDIITPSGEINITNLNPNFTGSVIKEEKSNTGSFGNKEYNPMEVSSLNINAETHNNTSMLMHERDGKNNNESILDGNKDVLFNTENIEASGTQLLFQGDYNALPYLIKKDNSSIVDRIYIDKDFFTVGRNKESSNLTIEEKSVSKQHAIIKKVNSDYFIIDKNSSNGTYVNGKRLQPESPYKLGNGDVITFAKQAYEFFDR